MTEKKILLVDDSPECLDILSMYIESEYDNDLELAQSGNAAIEILKREKSEFIAILSDLNMPEGNGDKLYQFIKDQNLDIPFILICGENLETLKKINSLKGLIKEGEPLPILSKPFKKQLLLNKLSEILKVSKKKEIQSGNYKRISIDRYLNWNTIRADIYIKLPSEKYVKIINESETFPFDIVKKYKDKNVDYVYLNEVDYIKMLEGASKKIHLALEKSINLPVNEKINLQFSAVQNIHEQMRNVGISEEVVTLTESAIDNTIKITRENPEVAKLMGNMMLGKNYIYELAMLTSFFSIAIAKNTQWFSDASLKKLSMAALFCDLGFENEQLAKIRDINGEEFKNLNKIDQDKILNHMVVSNKLLDQMKNLSSDCSHIIIEHHERPKKEGFPNKKDENTIGPLTCIFIIAQELAHYLLIRDKTDAQEFQRFIAKLKADYSKGNFKDQISALDKVFHLKK